MINDILKQKIDYSINLIRKAEPLALEYDSGGYRLAFSGGKDSMVLYAMAKEAGVKFHGEMQLTSIDPPQVMRFVREQYPDIHLNRPDINFYELIKKKKALPLRQMRFCCAYLKESHNCGQSTLIGIRREESVQRAKRNEIEISGHKFSGSLDQFNRQKECEVGCSMGKENLLIAPIINWTTLEVWDYIHEKNLPYCELYDCGYTRIGCPFCPMANYKMKIKDLQRFPKIAAKIEQSIQFLMDNNHYCNKFIEKYPQITAHDIFMAWISNKPFEQYFVNKYLQLNFFPDNDE